MICRMCGTIGCLRYSKLCWVGKRVNIIMKPTNSPSQGQPNPRKSRLKVAFGPLFPTANCFFRGLGLIFVWKTDYKKPNPTKFPIKHPNCLLIYILFACLIHSGEGLRGAAGYRLSLLVLRTKERVLWIPRVLPHVPRRMHYKRLKCMTQLAKLCIN